jgi:hypothetical protein
LRFNQSTGGIQVNVTVAAHLISCIRALRYLAIHTIEAFPHRRGVAIDSVIHQRARYEAQLLNLLTRLQLDLLM